MPQAERRRLAADFAAAMARLGPFEPAPALAAGVSGGADSMALALLARDWVEQRGGSLLALVVDHGLRAESATEAARTVARLADQGIDASLLALQGLAHGPGLAERARRMRYDALCAACAEARIRDLLVGHHAADQAETVAMRVLRGSHSHGLGGMSALVSLPSVRLLRPLLAIEPLRLRRLLIEQSVDWIEDPSNQDRTALRTRLRQGFARQVPPADPMVLVRAASVAGQRRAVEEARVNAELAARARIRPEGFAVLSPGRISVAALASLLTIIGGLPYPPGHTQLTELAMQPKAATVGGVRIVPGGRFADGFLLLREEAVIAKPAPARPGVIWDNRFQVRGIVRAGITIGKLGDDAARFRRHGPLPSVVMRGLPAFRLAGEVVAVPHLSYAATREDLATEAVFWPRKPLAGPVFTPSCDDLWQEF